MPRARERMKKILLLPLLLLLLLLHGAKPLELSMSTCFFYTIQGIKKNYSVVIRMPSSGAAPLRIPSTYRLCNYGVKIYAASSDLR